MFLIFVMVTFLRGFTKFSRADYLRYKAENMIAPDGVNAKVVLKLQICALTMCVHTQGTIILGVKYHFNTRICSYSKSLHNYTVFNLSIPF